VGAGYGIRSGKAHKIRQKRDSDGAKYHLLPLLTPLT